MQRVLVIGIPGAGKSTLSRKLARRTGLPLIHLDKEFWQPGWKVTPHEQWRPKVAALVAREAWVMDGNYDSSLDLRLPRADTVVWFDYPRRVALPRVLWRVAKTYGRVREDLAPGCPEKIDWEFLRYVWEFPSKERPRVVAMLAEHGQHLEPVVLRRDPDVARFLDGLAAT
jgi:adenylate kinase family enzyme